MNSCETTLPKPIGTNRRQKFVGLRSRRSPVFNEKLIKWVLKLFGDQKRVTMVTVDGSATVRKFILSRLKQTSKVSWAPFAEEPCFQRKAKWVLKLFGDQKRVTMVTVDGSATVRKFILSRLKQTSKVSWAPLAEEPCFQRKAKWVLKIFYWTQCRAHNN